MPDKRDVLTPYWEAIPLLTVLGHNPILLGPPGVGKSHFTIGLAHYVQETMGQDKVEVFVLNPAMHSPEEIIGYPSLDKERGIVYLYPTETALKILHEPPKGVLRIVVVDEANNSRPFVMAIARLAEVEGTLLLMSANPAQQSLTGNVLPAPLLDRASVIHFPPQEPSAGEIFLRIMAEMVLEDIEDAYLQMLRRIRSGEADLQGRRIYLSPEQAEAVRRVFDHYQVFEVFRALRKGQTINYENADPHLLEIAALTAAYLREYLKATRPELQESQAGQKGTSLRSLRLVEAMAAARYLGFSQDSMAIMGEALAGKWGRAFAEVYAKEFAVPSWERIVKERPTYMEMWTPSLAQTLPDHLGLREYYLGRKDAQSVAKDLVEALDYVKEVIGKKGVPPVYPIIKSAQEVFKMDESEIRTRFRIPSSVPDEELTMKRAELFKAIQGPELGRRFQEVVMHPALEALRAIK